MIPWAIYQYQDKEMISIHALPNIVCLGCIVFLPTEIKNKLPMMSVTG